MEQLVKATFFSMVLSIVYIPILFLSIFVMSYVFYFLSEYIYPFILGIGDSDSWINLFVNNLIVAFISAVASFSVISYLYKNYNMSAFIIPLLYTIVSVIGEMYYAGLNFDSVVNVISLIVALGVFFYYLQENLISE